MKVEAGLGVVARGGNNCQVQHVNPRGFYFTCKVVRFNVNILLILPFPEMLFICFSFVFLIFTIRT